jgi:hypothetical protein
VIRGVESRQEGEVVKISHVVAEEGRVVAVVEGEAAEELGVGDETAPTPADGGGAGEGGRLRGQAEEDLGEQVIDIQGRRRRRAGAAAAHLADSGCAWCIV